MKSKRCISNSTDVKNYLLENNLSYGDLVIAIGSIFVGSPYKAATLEAPGKEKMIVNLSAFDCTTFVETTLALAGCAILGKITHAELRKNLKFIRYRQGVISSYSSRLHYFTDWLRDNEKKKILKDISRQFEGDAQHKRINYMTTHRTSYPALKNEDEFHKMQLVEKNVSRKVFYIIGKDKINRQKMKIKNGDILAFATVQEGLDVTHAGFALWQGKNLHLLHASSKEGGVVISKKKLVAYLKSNKKFSGIIVARVL